MHELALTVFAACWDTDDRVAIRSNRLKNLSLLSGAVL